MPNKKLLIGEVSLEDLLERLAFAEEGVQHAALDQAKLYMAAATYRIKKMRSRQEAESALENIRVDLSLRVRAKQKGQKGVTERYLTDLVEANLSLRSMKEAASKAKRGEEWAKLLLEAYEHRRGSLKVLAQFAYMEDNFSGGGQDVVDRMRRKRERLKRELPDKEDEDFS
jgi:hypothetical protein